MTRRKARPKRTDLLVSRLIVLLLLLFPAACAAPVAVPKPVPKEPAAAAPDKTATTRPRITLLPARRPRPIKLPDKNVLKPERLIGLFESDLTRLLGSPDFRRDDPPAQLWQYRNSSCRFDVFLFQDKKRGNAYAVTHVEARGLDVNRVSSGDCYLSVLENRNRD